jgi:tripartite-type tricarboxylate transporter receptor subunit TctC
MYEMKIKLVGIFLTISLLLVLGLPAKAAEYPTKPITLINPFPAGGVIDVIGRALANSAKNYLDQPIICENHTGGGGTVGISLMVKKPADGYTISIPATSSLDINWHTREMTFHPVNDVTHIIRLTALTDGLVVRADSPWKTIQEFIQYAKQNPRKITYGSSGVGSPPHLEMEQLAILAGGIQWTHIPYKGAPETMTALLGGHLDAMAGAQVWVPLVDAGKLRLLATFSLRSNRFPQVPLMKDVGYDASFPAPIDILGPKGLPKPIVQKLHDVFKKCTEAPEFLAVLKNFDLGVTYLNSEDLEKVHPQEFERVGIIIKKLGLQNK